MTKFRFVVAAILSAALFLGACADDGPELVDAAAASSDSLLRGLAGTSWIVQTIDGADVEGVTLGFISSGEGLLASHTDACGTGEATLDSSEADNGFTVRSSSYGSLDGCVPHGSLNGLFAVGSELVFQVESDGLRFDAGSTEVVAVHFYAESVQTDEGTPPSTGTIPRGLVPGVDPADVPEAAPAVRFEECIKRFGDGSTQTTIPGEWFCDEESPPRTGTISVPSDQEVDRLRATSWNVVSINGDEVAGLGFGDSSDANMRVEFAATGLPTLQVEFTTDECIVETFVLERKGPRMPILERSSYLLDELCIPATVSFVTMFHDITMMEFVGVGSPLEITLTREDSDHVLVAERIDR